MTYVFLDLETTGLDYTSEQIIEIGAIKTDNALNQLEQFHTMVALQPGLELPEFITKLTGITQEDLVGPNVLDEKTALNRLAEFIEDAVIVAQNAPFDLSFISRGAIEPGRFICTRNLVRYSEPDLSASLKDVCARNGIELEGHHRSLNDVLATIEVFRKYRRPSDSSYMNVVMESPDRPLNFVPVNAKVRNCAMLSLSREDLLFLLNHDIVRHSTLGVKLDEAVNRLNGSVILSR